MGEVIRFVSKSERERVRLVREARAIYESVFPPADQVAERLDIPIRSHSVDDADTHRGGKGRLS